MFRTMTTAAAALLLVSMPMSAGAFTYATQVDVSGGGAGWDATTVGSNGTRSDPSNALGAPNAVESGGGSGFYSMGLDGIAVFDFGTAFDSEAAVFEVTFGCSGEQQTGGFCNYEESADIYVTDGSYTPSGDGSISLAGFTLVDSIPNGLANEPGGYTITLDGPFTFLALVDTTKTTFPDSPSTDGFDIDSVGVQPVPLPAPLAMLVVALGGLAVAGYRRTGAAA